MSSLHLDELYNEIVVSNEISIPNENQAYRSYKASRSRYGYPYRSYVTIPVGGVFRMPQAQAGGYSCSNCPGLCAKGGAKSTGCTNAGRTCHCGGTCNSCPSTCKSKGYSYVRCQNNGAQCVCETGAVVQKCNLSGAICKANNPRAASCTVQTFTNGTCSCNCKTATGTPLGPAPKPGSVASESKPVSSTPLKPGVIPSPGGLGSPEAEGTGTTRPLSTNTKFGSYDIAALRAQPPATYNAAVAAAAANRQYAALTLLQTAEGQDYYNQLGHVQRLAANLYNEFKAGKISEAELTRRYRQDIVPTAAKTLELGTKWRKAYYSASYAKSPGGYEANPMKTAAAKEVENNVKAAQKTAGLGAGLGSSLGGKSIGPIGAGIEGAVGDVANGLMTGHMPDAAQVLQNFTESTINNAANPQIPSPTVDIIKNILNDADTYKLFGLDRFTSGGAIPV